MTPDTLAWFDVNDEGSPSGRAIDPSAGEDTVFYRWYGLSLGVQAGDPLTLATSLWVQAQGWDACDDKPDDGSDPACTVSGNRTFVDFSSTAELQAVALSPGLTLTGSQAGFDCMGISQPIPEPQTWLLFGLGLGFFSTRALRRQAAS